MLFRIMSIYYNELQFNFIYSHSLLTFCCKLCPPSCSSTNSKTLNQTSSATIYKDINIYRVLTRIGATHQTGARAGLQGEGGGQGRVEGGKVRGTGGGGGRPNTRMQAVAAITV